MREAYVPDGFMLTRWVGLAMVLPALVAVALLGKDALMVVEKINENALRRETSALERGFKLMGELDAADVLSQSLGNDAFRSAVLANDTASMRRSFGATLRAADDAQQLVIVDGSGRVIVSNIGANAPSTSATRTAGLLAAAGVAMERARELSAAARAASVGLSHRIPRGMSENLFVTDMIKIDGRAALITVAPFVSSDVLRPDARLEATLLVGLQFITERMLRKLETLSHVKGLRLVPEVQSDKGGPVFPLLDSGGNAVARLTWDFSPPGYAILRAMLPAIALSLGLIALMTLVAAVTMRRVARQLAESERAAVHSSRHDTATGLANRGWFMRVFADLLAPGEKKNQIIAVLLIDCDYFKSVNDTLGHAAGDAVLAAIAERLKGLSQQIVIAARLGGDEFAVVTTPLAEPADAEAHGRDIEEALTAPVIFESYAIMVSVSIGVAVLETPSTLSIDTWLARADTALYRAKRDGRGCIRFYDISEDAGGTPFAHGTRNPANRRSVQAAHEAA